MDVGLNPWKSPGDGPPALPEPAGAVDIGDTDEPANPRAEHLGYEDSELAVSTTLGGLPVMHDRSDDLTAITVKSGFIPDVRRMR